MSIDMNSYVCRIYQKYFFLYPILDSFDQHKLEKKINVIINFKAKRDNYLIESKILFGTEKICYGPSESNILKKYMF